MAETLSTLRADLDAEITKYIRLRRTNGALAKGLILLSIMGSFVLTVVTASFPAEAVPYTGGHLKWIVLLSPIPGILGLIYTGIEPNRRSAWFSEKVMRLNNIRRLLSVSAIDDKDAAARLNEVDAEMEKVWQELSAHMVPPINSQIKAEGTKPGGQTATRPPVPATA